MQRQSTRRTFLTTVGVAGAMSVAGCSSLPGSGGSTSTPPTDTKNTDNGTNDDSGAPGTSVDDFEDISRWEVTNGRLRGTGQDVFQGSQSMVLEPKNGASEPVAKISRAFYPEALNLSSHDLSLAVKVNKPDSIKVRAEIIAPAQSTMLTSTRHIPIELDGWVRFDLGYTGKRGNPVLDSVTKVNVQIGPVDKPFQVLVDDLRKIPKPDTGKVMFQFDDGHVSAYETAYPTLKQNGWSGAVAVAPNAVGGDDRITEADMREMGGDGWDMIGHASELLPDHSSKEQRQILQQTKQYLEVKGFTNGARHFVAPYSRVDTTTLNHINDLFETGYLFGAGPNNAKHPSNSAFISRVQGPSADGTSQIVDMAAEFNQLAVISYHEIGSEGVSVDTFEQIVDHVNSKDVDVVTPSQLIDSDGW
ncbi:polysaccharide deacetylase family protein [Halocatena salina]|uniref:Polysaccharide deacetylase family protein n=1 Tax=Halocatena salina TaxID=2934340 RepID=A0A8U0A2K0_9EURY|nr:polysaccharide deacetylase family protein [Halocatena salina]UPM43302.1 polysaccharide deacetylase family protein [Halocatena salina]